MSKRLFTCLAVSFTCLGALAKARGWPTLTMEGDHNVQWSHPKELVRLLENAP